MLLAIDIGNSQIAAGIADSGGWRARWRLATDTRRTTDEYAVLLSDLFELSGFAADAVTGAVISSVVPGITSALARLCRDRLGLEPLVIGPGVHTGMDVRYQPAASLGTDRLVNALAARARWGAPVIVVDLGTATTFSVVDAHGAFAGGAIAPGVGTSADALFEAAARLRRVDLSPPVGLPVVGKSTENSMRSGVLYGHAGLVEGLLERLQREIVTLRPNHVPVVATGGFSTVVGPLVKRITAIEPQLVLDGLRMIAEMNGVPV